MARAAPNALREYPHARAITTRWKDLDPYGHMNNVVQYELFDTIVNAWLIERGALDIQHSPVIGLVVETGCNYFATLTYPEAVTAALRVAHIGRSSVRYEVALFAKGAASAAAQGHFVHVYCDRVTRKPLPLPAAVRQALEKIQAC
jgi:acyl-CoA thioester hydrolase